MLLHVYLNYCGYKVYAKQTSNMQAYIYMNYIHITLYISLFIKVEYPDNFSNFAVTNDVDDA
jgi:hypothetical protein